MARRRPSPTPSPAPPSRLPPGATPGPRLPDAPGLILVVDTREQRALDFTGVCPFVVKGLKTGDYSLLNHEHEITLERKSLSDLHSTVISDRPRFVRELERMRAYSFAAIIVEGTMRDVLSYLPPPRAAAHFTPAQLAAHPKTIINSLVSWSIEYGVRVFFADTDRNVCRALVLSLAKRVWRKHHPMNASEIVAEIDAGASPSPSPSSSEAPAA